MSRIAYEPSIDGLRAIAVIAVIIYHLAPIGLPGGFTGVDVFFVISGFLITRIITTDLDAGSFTLIRFYQRRIARILPPLLAMSLVTLAAASRIYTSQDFASAGVNFGATLLSIVNMKLMFQGNYFEMSPDAQPFLHCWSLAVEEQFYLLFPLMLAVLYRSSKQLAAIVGVAVFATSLGLCIWLSQVRPQWAFYVLPSRSWELLAGALVCRLPEGFFGGASRRLLACLGAMLLITAMVAMPSGSFFPGPLALWPVAGAVCVLLATTGSGESLLAKLLSTPGMRFIGAISYSLYLWHWPIFSFVDYAMLLQTEAIRMAVKISLCVLAALLSYKWIEIPSRSWLGKERHAFAAFAILAISMACGPLAGGWIRSHNYLNATAQDVAAGGVQANPGGANGAVMLIGDSIASMYGTALRDACEAEGYRLSVLSVAGANPLVSSPDDDNQLWRLTLKAIERKRPDVVVLGAAWDPRIRTQPRFPSLILQAIRQHAGQIVLINAVPDLPEEGSRAGIRAGARPPFYEPEDAYRLRLETNRLLARHLGDAIHLVDASQYFSRPNREVMVLDGENRCLYQDRGHVSGWGADQLVDDFRRILAAACDHNE